MPDGNFFILDKYTKYKERSIFISRRPAECNRGMMVKCGCGCAPPHRGRSPSAAALAPLLAPALCALRAKLAPIGIRRFK